MNQSALFRQHINIMLNNPVLTSLKNQMQHKYNMLCIPRKNIEGLQSHLNVLDDNSHSNDPKNTNKQLNYTNTNTKIQNTLCRKHTDNPLVIQTLKIFEKLEYYEQKGIKMIARSYLSAFPYILFSLSILEQENYPHLFTLIKQHFYRPGMFLDFQQSDKITDGREQSQQQRQNNRKKQQMILQICQNFFTRITNIPQTAQTANHQQKINSYILKQLSQSSIFLEACQHLFTKVLKTQSKSQEQFNNQTWIQEITLLCKKFNIDTVLCDFNDNYQIVANTQNCKPNNVQILSIGLNKIFYMVCQHNQLYYILQSDLAQKNRQLKSIKKAQNKNYETSQSPYSQEISQRHLIQVSEQSTPKFKDNQQSIRYRKRSHKNSFGGDMDIFNYHDLSNKLYKGQQKIFGNIQQSQSPKHIPNTNKIGQKKVLSERFQAFQMSPMTIGDQTDKNQTLQNPSNQQFKTAMRQSHIDGRGFKKQKYDRIRKQSKLSSSQILHINTRFKQSVQSKQSNKYLNNSSQLQPNTQQLKLPTQNNNNQIQFKMSFSPKDADRYQLAQQQNNIQNSSPKKQQPLKYQIQPIAQFYQQAQSSQQQDKKQNEQIYSQCENQYKDIEGQDQFQINNNDDERQTNNINNRIKNRKFSYLTQPISPTNRQSQILAQQSQIYIQQNYKKHKTTNKPIKIQKIHKNSQAITEGTPKLRFQENPISFSQIMIDEQHNFIKQQDLDQQMNEYYCHSDINDNKNRPIKAYKQLLSQNNTNSNNRRLNYERNVINFASGTYLNKQSKHIQYEDDNYVYKQPKNWIKKQIIYHFTQKPPQKFTIQRYTDVNKKYGNIKKIGSIEQMQWQKQSYYKNNNKNDDETSIQIQEHNKQKNSVYSDQKTITPMKSIESIKKNSNKKIKNQQKYIRSTIDTQIMSASPVCRYSQTKQQIPKNQQTRIKINKQLLRDSKYSKKINYPQSINQQNQNLHNSDRNKPKFIPNKNQHVKKISQQQSNNNDKHKSNHQLKNNTPKFIFNRQKYMENQQQHVYHRNISHQNIYHMSSEPTIIIPNNSTLTNHNSHSKTQAKFYYHPQYTPLSPKTPYQTKNLYGSHPSPQSRDQLDQKSSSDPKIQLIRNQPHQFYIPPKNINTIQSPKNINTIQPPKILNGKIPMLNKNRSFKNQALYKPMNNQLNSPIAANKQQYNFIQRYQTNSFN